MTARRASVWEAVAQIVNNGQAPRIRLNPDAEVKPAKKVERPTFRDPHNPFAHYATPAIGNVRPKCLMCKKQLRTKDVEVCSADCGERFLTWARFKIARIEGGKIRIPITQQTVNYLRGAA